MIQVSDFIAMFAAFTARTSVLIYKRRAFLCPIGSIVSKDIRLSIPIREYPFFIDCILVLAGTGRRQPSLYLNISNTFSLMARTDVICNAVNNSTRTATSAHETCTFLTSFFKAFNFVKSKLLRMFAMFTPRTKHNISNDGLFYAHSEVLYSKDIRLSNPKLRMTIIADRYLVLGGTGRRQPLLYSDISNTLKLMPRTDVICNAVNNSTRTATSAHETCTFLTSFQTLETLIPQLHEARIRFRKNRVTGVFNITGRYTTMSAPTMEQLISNVLEKQREYRRYIDENRKQKILNHELR